MPYYRNRNCGYKSYFGVIFPENLAFAGLISYILWERLKMEIKKEEIVLGAIILIAGTFIIMLLVL